MKRIWKKCGHPRTKENTRGVSARLPGGRCRICLRVAQARHNRTAKRRATQARYERTEKRRAARARYGRTEKRRAAQARYRNSEKGVLAHRRSQDAYRASGGRARASARYRAHRKSFLNTLIEGEATWTKMTYGRN